MKHDDLTRKINKVLTEKETFLLSLMILAQMYDDEEYSELTQLIFLFDSYKGFKRFIKYFEGATIKVPTVIELKKSLKLLELFQRVYIDKMNLDDAYDKLRLYELGMTKSFCTSQIDKFKHALEKDGGLTIKQIRKLANLK